MITNPAPAPLTMVTVATNSGDVTVPAEYINEWLAITSVFYMDEDGKTWLDGAFTLTHVPSGRAITDGSGCIVCCRAAGKALAGIDADWSALTDENSRDWSAAISVDDKKTVAICRSLSFICDAEYCEEADEAEGEGRRVLGGTT